MNPWLARGIDLAITHLVIRPLVSRLHAKTDRAALAEHLERFRGATVEDLFPGPTPPPVPAVVQEIKPRRWGRAFDVRFPSAAPVGDATVDTIIARVLLPPGSPTPKALGGAADPMPPTLLVIPGWLTQSVVQYEMYVARHALTCGAAVMIMETPYHHRRTPGGHVSGVLALSGDLLRTAGMLRQAVADAGRCLAWLRDGGAGRVGAVGESLGGWIAALLGERVADLDMLLCTVPPVTLDELLRSSPLVSAIARDLRSAGVTRADLSAAMAVVSPLRYPLRVPVDRVSLVEATLDAMVPGDGIRRLWEHWSRPRMLTLHEGHISHRFHPEFREWLKAEVRGRLTQRDGKPLP